MDEDNNVLDDFSKDFPAQNQGEDFLTPTTAQTPEQGAQDEEEGKPNREHRRLNRRIDSERQALQELREANIREAALLEARSEQSRFLQDLPNKNLDERLITLYGNDENGKKAAQITASLLEDAVTRAEARALDKFQEAAKREEQEVRQNEEYIDTQLEDLEDESGLDLTSNSPMGRKNRKEFLDLVEKFSSKDGDGNVTEYADFGQVFDTFRQSHGRDNSRSKNLASRGQVQGGSSNVKSKDIAMETYLKNNGII